MENVTDVLIAILAIAVQSDWNALGTQEICHGLGVIPEEIAAGCGNVSGRIVLCDISKHLQTGVGCRNVFTKIIFGGGCAFSGSQCSGIIHTAVQSQRLNGDIRHAKVK